MITDLRINNSFTQVNNSLRKQKAKKITHSHTQIPLPLIYLCLCLHHFSEILSTAKHLSLLSIFSQFLHTKLIHLYPHEAPLAPSSFILYLISTTSCPSSSSLTRQTVASGVLGLAPKWLRLAPNGTNPGLFQIRFQAPDLSNLRLI